MITADQAHDVITAARSTATELGVTVNIAVLDSGGHLKAFCRMDGAVLGSIDVAMRKARTAVLFGCESETVWEYCRPGAAAPALELSNDGLAPYAGGIPLRAPSGTLIGAIGVSGAAIAQDLEIARAGAAACRP
ncbi:GlcG/HbpS family heme-binding protein [Geminicoccus flavidas]|uniref:GlcG/HbpS family heme-binding protein n=1 Tax=Geminicoccus flavidas TaxID=2506407 RepID=UPI0013581F8E|nr:heme-binding protein [Geminicoccus flavidas]